MSDEELMACFERRIQAQVEKGQPHVVLVVKGLVGQRAILEAIQRFSSRLVKFETAHGKPDRYHETITWAFLFLIRERMARAQKKQTWAEFAAENGDLLDWENGILKEYYRDETLASGIARSMFILPDRMVG